MMWHKVAMTRIWSSSTRRLGSRWKCKSKMQWRLWTLNCSSSFSLFTKYCAVTKRWPPIPLLSVKTPNCSSDGSWQRLRESLRATITLRLWMRRYSNSQARTWWRLFRTCRWVAVWTTTRWASSANKTCCWWKTKFSLTLAGCSQIDARMTFELL